MIPNLTELKSELTAPVKSIRIFAISRAIELKASQELLDCLCDCLKQETDPECQMLLQHAVNNARQNMAVQSEKSETTLEEIERLFPVSDPEKQLDLLTSIKTSKIKNMDPVSLVPKLLQAVGCPVVASAVVRKFTRYWPENSLEFLVTNVFSTTKCLQIACIETLMKAFPDRLKSQLHKIIHVNDPVIRSLAILTMSSFFPELAADFIVDSLEKGDYYSKATALQVCSTMNFSLIKQSILNLIQTDSDQESSWRPAPLS